MPIIFYSVGSLQVAPNSGVSLVPKCVLKEGNTAPYFFIGQVESNIGDIESNLTAMCYDTSGKLVWLVLTLRKQLQCMEDFFSLSVAKYCIFIQMCLEDPKSTKKIIFFVPILDSIQSL